MQHTSIVPLIPFLFPFTAVDSCWVRTCSKFIMCYTKLIMSGSYTLITTDTVAAIISKKDPIMTTSKHSSITSEERLSLSPMLSPIAPTFSSKYPKCNSLAMNTLTTILSTNRSYYSPWFRWCAGSSWKSTSTSCSPNKTFKITMITFSLWRSSRNFRISSEAKSDLHAMKLMHVRCGALSSSNPWITSTLKTNSWQKFPRIRDKWQLESNIHQKLRCFRRTRKNQTLARTMNTSTKELK